MCSRRLPIKKGPKQGWKAPKTTRFWGILLRFSPVWALFFRAEGRGVFEFFRVLLARKLFEVCDLAHCVISRAHNFSAKPALFAYFGGTIQLAPAQTRI